VMCVGLRAAFSGEDAFARPVLGAGRGFSGFCAFLRSEEEFEEGGRFSSLTLEVALRAAVN